VNIFLLIGNPFFLICYFFVELTETLVFLGGEDERVVVRGVEVYNPERYELIYSIEMKTNF
jgi:hypothetical protein